jgi:hypothetical protein
MKKIWMVLLLVSPVLAVWAQDDEDSEKEKEEKPATFSKYNMIGGGNFTASFFGVTAVGLSPYVGFKLTPFLDAAASINFFYQSQPSFNFTNDRIRQTILAPGAFIRIFPVNFLYAEAHFEHNFIWQRYKPGSGSPMPDEKINFKVNSLLCGIGYTSGRAPGSDNFFYFSVSWDLMNQDLSPYTDNNRRPYPVMRAGFNFKLFNKRD